MRTHRPTRRLAVPVILLALLALPNAALADTNAAEVLAPTVHSESRSPLSVTFKLPEAAKPHTLVVFLENQSHEQTAVTLGSSELSAGEHTVTLLLHELGKSAGVEAASAETVADGTYTVGVQYQNEAAEPLAITEVADVVLKTHTSTPTLSLPTSGSESEGTFEVFPVEPEAASPGSSTLTLISTTAPHPQYTYLLAGVEHEVAPFVFDPADPESAPEVVMGTPTGPLPYGTYDVVFGYQDVLGNPAATASAVEVTVTPYLCDAGYYSASGEPPCDEATPGHYVEGRGATVQIACPAGTYDPSSASTLKTACQAAQAGHYVSSVGAAAQQECSAGEYQPSSGQFQCIVAGPGHYVNAPGATAQTACAAGSYAFASESIICSEAPAGYFDAGEGNTLAFACAAGTYNESHGATSSAACLPSPPGYYAGPGRAHAIACVPGTYQPNYGAATVAACLDAPPGTWTLEGSWETNPCYPGTYAEGTNNTSCENAQPGYYVATVESSQQTPCPAGHYSDETGAAACKVTPAGSYSGEAASSPTPCPAGSESPAEASRCTPIPATVTGSEGGQSTPKAPVTTGAALTAPSPAPTLTKVSLSQRCPALSAMRAHGRASVIVKLSYAVSQASKLTFTISRSRAPRAAAKCPPHGTTNAAHVEARWSATEHAGSGVHNLVLLATQPSPASSPKGHRPTDGSAVIKSILQASTLKAGTYTVTVQATNAQGVRSTPVTVQFWVVAPTRRRVS